MKAIKPF